MHHFLRTQHFHNIRLLKSTNIEWWNFYVIVIVIIILVVIIYIREIESTANNARRVSSRQVNDRVVTVYQAEPIPPVYTWKAEYCNAVYLYPPPEYTP